MWKDRSSIQTKFFRNMLYITLASISLWCLDWLQGEYSSFRAESEAIRADYITYQKTILKSEVNNVIRYINDIKKLSNRKLKSTLKERVYEANLIATNIYQENSASKDLPEIKKMIKDALRPIRFHDGHGYYFAISMDGTGELYPVNPELEGKNLLNRQDANGNFVIQDEIKIIETEKKGFTKQFWTKSENKSSTTHAEILFIQYFKQLDWYLGAGDYLDDFKERMMLEVLTRIVQLRFGSEGYFFGSTYDGDPLFSNGEITRKADNIWNLTDPNGVKIIQEQRKAVANPDGGFVHYSWHKLNTESPSAKISFVQGIQDWEWTIGAGVYLDTIEKHISDRKTTLIARFKKSILGSVLILALLFCLIIFWSKRISLQIQKSVETFSIFLNRANSDSVSINPDDIKLKEFREIAVLTNKMLEDRSLTEEALRESEEKYRSIFENAIEGFFQSTPEGRFTSVNPAFAHMLGYRSPQEAVSSIINIAEQYYVDHEDRKRYEQILQKDGFVEHFRFRALRKDGSEVWVSNTTRVIYDQNNNIVRYEGNITDVTIQVENEKERLKLESQLRQAQKMEAIGTLAGGIAHDFNNILAAILGYSEIARDQLPADDPIRRDLDEVISAGDRAADLVKQILTFSRMGEENSRPLKIQFIIKEVLKLLRSSLPTTIQLKEDIDADCGSILANPTQIHQLLINLCTNAKHAIGDQIGTLSISLSTVQIVDNHTIVNCPQIDHGTYINLEISDTGCGMDILTQSKIFDPFFTTKDKGTGTGLGLAVVHGIIKQHQGEITVVSQPGKGTTFNIYLPVIKEQVQPDPATVQDMVRGNERILVVDDETVIVHILQRMLDNLGYTVTVFTSSIEALNAYTKNPDNFDLLITDMTMPEMTGIVLTRKLLALRPDFPVILCTGYNEAIDESVAKSHGIREYIMKPVDKHTLAQAIRKALASNPDFS